MHVSFAAVVGFVAAGLCVSCSQPVSPTPPTSIQSNTAPLTLAGENATTVAGLAISDHGTQEVPFKGHLEGVVTLHFDQPPFLWWAMSGSGNATQLGRFTVSATSLFGIPWAGYYTFTAANGDTLNAFFQLRRQSGTPFIVEDATIEDAGIFGGSGRFAGASGVFTINRSYEAITGGTTGSFEGTISAGRAPADVK